jgi:hypothetical protein
VQLGWAGYETLTPVFCSIATHGPVPQRIFQFFREELPVASGVPEIGRARVQRSCIARIQRLHDGLITFKSQLEMLDERGLKASATVTLLGKSWQTFASNLG